MCVRFCPTSLHWADVTTEGLVIYSLESDLAFDPIDLDIDLTPQNLLSVFKKGECSKALLMSLRMNEQAYIGSILENIPVKEIPLVISSIPERFLGVMMEILGKVLDSNPVNLEYLLVWSGALLSTHGILLRRKRAQFGSSIRKLRAAIDRLHKSISEIACRNLYTIDFITSKTSLSPDQCEPFEDTRIKRVRSAA
jgi:periodic tryptophan protein 2